MKYRYDIDDIDKASKDWHAILRHNAFEMLDNKVKGRDAVLKFKSLRIIADNPCLHPCWDSIFVDWITEMSLSTEDLEYYYDYLAIPFSVF